MPPSTSCPYAGKTEPCPLVANRLEWVALVLLGKNNIFSSVCWSDGVVSGQS